MEEKSIANFEINNAENEFSNPPIYLVPYLVSELLGTDKDVVIRMEQEFEKIF